MTDAATMLDTARRIVVKVGSTLLIDDDSGFRHRWFEQFIAEIAGFGAQVVVVSSGATGCGRVSLGLGSAVLPLEEEQAAAAVGQVELAQRYSDELARHGRKAAQVLLTSDDTEQRRRYINAHNTLTTLLRFGVIPIINENDAVTTRELRFGDNDRLAARVAAMVSADVLVVLSNVDGLYRSDPNEVTGAGDDSASDHIPIVSLVDAEIESYAGTGHSRYSRGGMRTKIDAAKMALAAGTSMILASGISDRPLTALSSGARCTCFVASVSAMQARKRWIASIPNVRGTIVVDDGACSALAQMVSLLPAGVVRVDGEFGRGDAVLIVNGGGERVALGLCAYSSDEARRIIGMRSAEVTVALGSPARAAMVHRDNLVLLTS